MWRFLKVTKWLKVKNGEAVVSGFMIGISTSLRSDTFRLGRSTECTYVSGNVIKHKICSICIFEP